MFLLTVERKSLWHRVLWRYGRIRRAKNRVPTTSRVRPKYVHFSPSQFFLVRFGTEGVPIQSKPPTFTNGVINPVKAEVGIMMRDCMAYVKASQGGLVALLQVQRF